MHPRARVWRRDTSDTTWFVTDGINLLAELGGQLQAKAAYVHGPGIDFPLAMLRDGQEAYSPWLAAVTQEVDEEEKRCYAQRGQRRP